ncbi:MAG: hypothetical protein WA435_06685 [Gallionellaceae bacterium]
MSTKNHLKKVKQPAKNLPGAMLDLSEWLFARNPEVCDEVLAVIKVTYRALVSKNPRATINRSFGQLRRGNHSFYHNVVNWLERHETAILLSGSGHWWSAVEWHRAFSEMTRGVKPSLAWRINGRPAEPGMRDAEEAGIYSIYLHKIFGLCKSNADMQAAKEFGVDESAVRRNRNRYDGLDIPSVISWVKGTFLKYKMELPEPIAGKL